MHHSFARRRNTDSGFTLVELMVVVMIIAVLMAVAIPTFLSSRRRAQDSAARSNVRNALAAAQALYSENQSYASVNTTTLAAEEPGLTFVATGTASTGPKEISVNINSAGDTIVLAAESASGKCIALKHSIATTGGGTTKAESDGTCSGTAAAGLTTFEPL